MSTNMSDADSLLIFHRVSKHYGSVAALDEFSMRVEPGRILGVLGRNGAGQSTMMGLIVGQLAPSSGTLQVLGQQAPLSAKTRRRIGFAPQRLALYEALTARENLEVFAAVYGLFGRAARRAIERALDLVDLSTVASRQVRHCSGGMRRRLNLAAALLQDADLILLDEPTAGVDIQSREKILEVVRDSAAGGSPSAPLANSSRPMAATRWSATGMPAGSGLPCGRIIPAPQSSRR